MKERWILTAVWELNEPAYSVSGLTSQVYELPSEQACRNLEIKLRDMRDGYGARVKITYLNVGVF